MRQWHAAHLCCLPANSFLLNGARVPRLGLGVCAPFHCGCIVCILGPTRLRDPGLCELSGHFDDRHACRHCRRSFQTTFPRFLCRLRTARFHTSARGCACRKLASTAFVLSALSSKLRRTVFLQFDVAASACNGGLRSPVPSRQLDGNCAGRTCAVLRAAGKWQFVSSCPVPRMPRQDAIAIIARIRKSRPES